MSCCLIIPTYWSTYTIESWKVFDHPFPIEEEGTLLRTLENLEQIGIKEDVIILPVPFSEEISNKVLNIVKKVSELNITVLDSLLYSKVVQTLEKTGMKKSSLCLVDTYCYGGVRNLGLVYAQMKGFDNVIMIDDDEVIRSDYIEKALKHLKKEFNGELVLAKTGCVEDSAGRKVYEGQAHNSLLSWPKDKLFNEEVNSMLTSSQMLCQTSIAFGGNMILNKKVFSNVPFDPFGTRGEDDDYVLNCKYCGYKMFFDPEVLLIHLPPERKQNYWSRQRQDIIRFRYVREKTRLFKIDKKDLGIFFTYFTGDDLEKKAVNSSIDAALSFEDNNRQEFIGFLNNAKEAVEERKEIVERKIETFKSLIDVWQQTLGKLN
ncbi:MAG: hypothetical protein WC162_06390 [Sphaerochaetaceae bacterium]